MGSSEASQCYVCTLPVLCFEHRSVEKVGVLNESQRDTPSSNQIKMNSVLIKPEGFIQVKRKSAIGLS